MNIQDITNKLTTSSGKNQSICTRQPAGLTEVLDLLADMRGQTRTDVIQEALLDYLVSEVSKDDFKQELSFYQQRKKASDKRKELLANLEAA